ncbi:C40 family peptidase [Corynebacterium ammoniagenes]|uniref:Endopeptidase Cgl2188 n=2 Tax=Corynebacterium ammoniagenes TaxID=1697 RepID=A0AAV5G4P8_CORAM|nr:C40 family peptidase [Corynebacterium ammoniagenes]APT82279.1 endopeptidase [Corynebacterium ammoniagenes DSM 20306]AQS73373.1 endopeptidase [Corynebacterium ammoniagenes]EFG82485.1 NlpC/P60 family protein [Corynebacterium ammoniagenes DSM 20306]NMF31115.1 C40 family peptidase [Corynebacterium ammoniagenes]GJN42107.1 putative endopeptidase Cgl2188 [Corynebacterium ammoniagenes]
MAQHRRQNVKTVRRIAGTTAIAAVATLAGPAAANAAEVVVPNTDYSFNVEGLENVPNIDQIPNVDQYVPSLSAQETTSTTNYSAEAPAQPATSSTGQQVVDAVYSKIGSPYGWGAAGPSTFDCSGLTSWAYAQAGKEIPRTSQAQASGGTPVAISDLQPGDIVAYYGGASHVGIYVGNGTIVDSLNSGSTVSERPLDYMPIHSAVRF